jgi:hypothetical protein
MLNAPCYELGISNLYPSGILSRALIPVSGAALVVPVAGEEIKGLPRGGNAAAHWPPLGLGAKSGGRRHSITKQRDRPRTPNA